MEDPKYIVEVVRPEDITDEMEEEGLDVHTIDEIAVDYFMFNDPFEAVKWLINSLNSDSISDQNYYFLIDCEGGHIIEQPNYLK